MSKLNLRFAFSFPPFKREMAEAGAATTQKRLVKRKPARQQVEVGFVEKKGVPQTGTTFNVWYGKWAGGDKYDQYNLFAALLREKREMNGFTRKRENKGKIKLRKRRESPGA